MNYHKIKTRLFKEGEYAGLCTLHLETKLRKTNNDRLRGRKVTHPRIYYQIMKDGVSKMQHKNKKRLKIKKK